MGSKPGFLISTKTNTMTPQPSSKNKVFLTGKKQGQTYKNFVDSTIKSLKEQGFFAKTESQTLSPPAKPGKEL